MHDGTVLAEARSAIERIAQPAARQVEWASRTEVAPAELARESLAAVRAVRAEPAYRLSPLLGLRLEALAAELESLSGKGAAPFEDSDWTFARHLADLALRDPGWPGRAGFSGDVAS